MPSTSVFRPVNAQAELERLLLVVSVMSGIGTTKPCDGRCLPSVYQPRGDGDRGDHGSTAMIASSRSTATVVRAGDVY